MLYIIVCPLCFKLYKVSANYFFIICLKLFKNLSRVKEHRGVVSVIENSKRYTSYAISFNFPIFFDNFIKNNIEGNHWRETCVHKHGSGWKDVQYLVTCKAKY